MPSILDVTSHVVKVHDVDGGNLDNLDGNCAVFVSSYFPALCIAFNKPLIMYPSASRLEEFHAFKIHFS
jgi:hypothetical protein